MVEEIPWENIYQKVVNGQARPRTLDAALVVTQYTWPRMVLKSPE
jgi:hypothetical protein